MEKVKGFFRNFNEKRSYQIVFFVVSMCTILSLYAGVRVRIITNKAHEYTIVEDKSLIKYVEEAYVDGNALKISGWCFNKGVNSNNQEIQVFLRNLEDENDVVWMDVERVKRDDVNDYYECSYDYSQTGFEARANVRKLDLQKKNYEIFLKVSYSREEGENTKVAKTVSSKRYVVEGALTALEPRVDKEPVRTTSIELNTIFDNGQLLLYREDFDIYVYQYEGKLYWVAGEKFFFEEDATTYIQYQLDTSRIDKLPKSRLENEWYWDNIGFNFEEYEITEKEFAPYRVAVKDIPTEYPVLCFWTGYYVNTWVWEEYLNLDIREVN